MSKKSGLWSDDGALFISNQMIYEYYYNRLMEVALSQFEYQNLPDTCDREFFERKLLQTGKAMFCKPKGSDDILSLGFANCGMLDVYGHPTEVYGVGFTMEDSLSGSDKKIVNPAFKQIATDEFVYCYDNILRKPIIYWLDLYAKLLWECHMTVRANQKFQNIPYIVKTSSDTRLTVENFFLEWANFKPYLEVRSMGKNNDEDPKTFNLKDIDTMDLRVDYRVIDMWKALKITWAEALSMLGITSQYTKKSQYENSDQLEMDKMSDDYSLSNRLMRRVEFCNKVNDKWKLDMAVNLSPMTEEFQRATNLPMDMVLAEMQFTGGSKINSDNSLRTENSFNNNTLSSIKGGQRNG